MTLACYKCACEPSKGKPCLSLLAQETDSHWELRGVAIYRDSGWSVHDAESSPIRGKTAAQPIQHPFVQIPTLFGLKRLLSHFRKELVGRRWSSLSAC